MSYEVRPVEQLEKRIGYVYRNKEIINIALTPIFLKNSKAIRKGILPN